VQNKSPADLLVAILDPNREAQPAFIGYSLVTTDGRVINGLVVGESAGSITLRRAEGKEDVVARNDIEELFSTGRTLMPDGLEKDITPQQFADIIAFIKSLGASVSKP
jgi:putative heme-binding domain-containing protein